MRRWANVGEDAEQGTRADETTERIHPLAKNYPTGEADESGKEEMDGQIEMAKGQAAAQIMERAERQNFGLTAMTIYDPPGLARLVMTGGIHRILRGCEHPPALAKPSDERAVGEPARRLSRVVVLGDSEFAETGARLGDDPAGILGLELLGIEAAAI